MDEKLVARFESKFDKTNGGCWNWKASLAGKGYGQIKLTGERRQEYAHRVSWTVYRGEIPEGRQVLHRCDNPKCVNPDHLFLGVGNDNAQDMKAKGRHLYGSRNGNAKLTEDDVRKIKRCLADGMTQKQIGAAFSISQIQVSRIHTGRRWAHVK